MNNQHLVYKKKLHSDYRKTVYIYDQAVAKEAMNPYIKNLFMRLRQIEQALTRLEQGEYGFCLQCHKFIQEKRLKMLPHAALCIECQSKKEEGKKYGVPL
jgi:RNA polymerase-binding transcription factor DksA